MKLDTSFFKNNKKLLPLFIGGGVLLLGVIVFVLYWFVLGDVKPSYVRVTNQTDSSFTVSWVSTKKSKGQVLVREDGKFLPGVLAPLGADKFYDDRDVVKAELEAGEKRTEKAAKEVEDSEDKVIDVNNYNFDVKVRKQGRYYVHSVTVSNLEADTEYSFRIGNGLKWYGDGVVKDNSDTHFTFGSLDEKLLTRTLVLPEDQSFVDPKPTYGLLSGEELNLHEDVLVFSYFADPDNVPYSLALSSPVNEDDGWYIDQSNARFSDGYVWSAYKETAYQDIEVLFVKGGKTFRNTLKVSLGSNAPVGTMILVEEPVISESDINIGLEIVGKVFAGNCDAGGCWVGDHCAFSARNGGDGCMYDCSGPNGSWQNPHDCGGSTAPVVSTGGVATQEPVTPTHTTQLPGQYGEVTSGDYYTTSPGCGSKQLIVCAKSPYGQTNISPGQKCACADSCACPCVLPDGSMIRVDPGQTCVAVRAELKDPGSNTNCGGVSQPLCDASVYSSVCDSGLSPGRSGVCITASYVYEVCNSSSCEIGKLYSDGKLCTYEAGGKVCKTGTSTGGGTGGDVGGVPSCPVSGSCSPTMVPGSSLCKTSSTVVWYCCPEGKIIVSGECKDRTGLYPGAGGGGGSVTPAAPPDSRSDCGGSGQNPCNDTLGLGGNACDTGNHMTNDRCCSDGQMFCGVGEGCSEARCQSGRQGQKGCNGDDDCSDPTYPNVKMVCINQGWGYMRRCSTVNEIPAEQKVTCAKWCTKETKNQVWVDPTTGEHKTCVDPLIGAPHCVDTVLEVNGSGAGGMLSAWNTKVWADDLNTEDGFLIINDPGLYTMIVNGEVLTGDVDGEETIAFFVDKNGNDYLDEGDEVVDVNVIQIELKKEAETFNYQFSEGYNYVSFPFVGDDKNNLKTMSAVLQYLNSKGIEATVMATYDGGWKAVDYREVKDIDLGVEGKLYGVNDFPINPGKGYVIRVINGGGQISLTGYKVNEAVPVEMDDAWNLIGVHGLSTYDGYTADDLIASIKSQDIPAEIATQWIRGRYESRIIKDVEGTERKFGNDFPIEEYKAYFVQVNGGTGVWEPEKKE